MTILSSTLAALGVHVYIENQNGGVKDILLLKSSTLADDIMLWPGMNISEAEDEIVTLYQTHITPLTLLFSVIDLAAEFLIVLLNNFFRDTLFIASLYLNHLTKTFRAKLDKIANSDEQLSWIKLAALYREYEYIHTMSGDIETIFGSFFKCLHVFNLLSCSYTALEILRLRSSAVSFIQYLILDVKIAGAYFNAMKLSGTVIQTDGWEGQRICRLCIFNPT